LPVDLKDRERREISDSLAPAQQKPASRKKRIARPLAHGSTFNPEFAAFSSQRALAQRLLNMNSAEFEILEETEFCF